MEEFAWIFFVPYASRDIAWSLIEMNTVAMGYCHHGSLLPTKYSPWPNNLIKNFRDFAKVLFWKKLREVIGIRRNLVIGC